MEMYVCIIIFRWFALEMYGNRLPSLRGGAVRGGAISTSYVWLTIVIVMYCKCGFGVSSFPQIGNGFSKVDISGHSRWSFKIVVGKEMNINRLLLRLVYRLHLCNGRVNLYGCVCGGGCSILSKCMFSDPY